MYGALVQDARDKRLGTFKVESLTSIELNSEM